MGIVNILSAAQADPADAGVGMFTSFTGAGGSLTTDSSTSVVGASSLKVILDGSAGFQFVTAEVLAASWVAGQQYTASWYIKGSAGSVGKTLRYFVDSSGGAISATAGRVTLTTSWQRISVTFTAPNPVTFTWAGPRLDTGGTEAATFWLDALALMPGALIGWVPGGGQTQARPANIAGLPVNVVAGSLSLQNQVGQRSTGSIDVYTPLGVTWQYGTQVQVWDDNGALKYAGYTTKDKVTKAGARLGTGYLEHSLQLMDNCYKADKRVIWYQNLNVSAGQIAQDLVNKVLYQEGVTYTATSIANGATVPEVIWNGKQISAALTWLATNSGYWWNIDINGVLWFQPYSALPAPFTLDGSQVEAGTAGGLSVTYGNDMLVNVQYTKGGNSTKGSKKAPLIEIFHGDGARRNFTLGYPVSSVYQVLQDGTDVTAQSLTKGSSGGFWYYAPGDAVIAQDPGQTVLGSGDTLEVHYDGRTPAIGKASNPTLIATQKAREGAGGSGIIESVYADTKVHTLSAALAIAAALLAHYGADMTVLEFDILASMATGILEGQMITANLADFNLNNALMLVTTVTPSDQNDGYNLWLHVTAVGSPYDAAQFQTFWQNLMNQQSDASDLSDVNDLQLTPIVTSTFSHTPSFSTSGSVAQSPICGVTSGAHTMICGNWVTS